jgi:hypothetical protein
MHGEWVQSHFPGNVSSCVTDNYLPLMHAQPRRNTRSFISSFCFL